MCDVLVCVCVCVAQNHPDYIKQLEKYTPSTAASSEKAKLPPLTPEEKETLVREIMGLHDGPTFYEFCNGKAPHSQPHPRALARLPAHHRRRRPPRVATPPPPSTARAARLPSAGS